MMTREDRVLVDLDLHDDIDYQGQRKRNGNGTLEDKDDILGMLS
jgi:hypothetical protein